MAKRKRTGQTTIYKTYT